MPDSGESLAEEVLRRLGYDDEAAPEFTEFALSFFAQNKNKSGLPTETSWNGLTMVDMGFKWFQSHNLVSILVSLILHVQQIKCLQNPRKHWEQTAHDSLSLHHSRLWYDNTF